MCQSSKTSCLQPLQVHPYAPGSRMHPCCGPRSEEPFTHPSHFGHHTLGSPSRSPSFEPRSDPRHHPQFHVIQAILLSVLLHWIKIVRGSTLQLVFCLWTFCARVRTQLQKTSRHWLLIPSSLPSPDHSAPDLYALWQH